ncbi:MAG: hypothetical protein RL179_487 [Planctomycetota bacterium]
MAFIHLEIDFDSDRLLKSWDSRGAKFFMNSSLINYVHHFTPKN